MRFGHWPVLLAGLALLVPVAAQGSGSTNPGGDTPGRPEVREDGAYCFEMAEDLEGVTCTVLYAHIFDLLNRVPINVQHPNECSADLARGFTAFPTVEPLYDFNQLDFYSSAGFVGYVQGSCDDPYIHPEQGLTRDVEIVDAGIPVRGWFYLSADADEYSMLGQDPEADTGAMPCLTVRMTIATGHFYDEGEVIAEGETTKTIVNSAAAPETELPFEDVCPGASGTLRVEDVSEFVVDMGQPALNLPRKKAFVVHVEWWQHDASGRKVAQREWNVHTGVDHKTRVVLPVKNPLWIERLDVRPYDDKVYVVTAVNSPWGSYDVDPASIGMELFDDSGAEVRLGHVGEPNVVWCVEHGCHWRPVTATIAWDVAAEGLEPGTYALRVSAMNWQHTATASKDVPVQIEDDRVECTDCPAPPPPKPERPVPSLPLVAALLPLAAFVIARRLTSAGKTRGG